MTTTGTWYPPSAGTGGFLIEGQLFTNPPFAMTDHDPHGIDQHQPGAKLDALKPRPALVLGGFSRALMAVTHVGTYGAIKYTPRGWESVPDGIERYSEAMMRHWLAEASGEQQDPESNFLHAAHVAWNALARLELMLRKMEGEP
jgi:hypothetical protein